MPPSSTPRQRLGRDSERLAAKFLAGQGFAVEAVNVRVPGGELDIVAREGGVLCFVEVRSTSSDAWGGPLASVTAGKQRRFIRAVRWYLARQAHPEAEVRFDVVAITWRGLDAPAIELVRGAFDASGYF